MSDEDERTVVRQPSTTKARQDPEHGMVRAAVILLLSFASVSGDVRAEVTGRARIIDGGTIEIAGQRIRLFGVDAPEAGQTCGAEKEWRCGQQAAFALSTIIGSHWVHCAERGRDPYGRVVAVCRLSGPNGPDVSAEMVRQGWALADAADYVTQQAEAKAAHRGMWRGSLQRPWVGK